MTNPVMINFKSLKNPAVYAVAILLAFILLFDFTQRVWQPLQVRDSNLAELTASDLFPHEALARPEVLAAWLQQYEQDLNTEQGEQESSLKEVRPLPGSVLIANENIRVRAIFVSTADTLRSPKPTTQALALVEMQHNENGTINRAVWRLGDIFAGWVVTAIEPNRVLLNLREQAAALEQKQEQQAQFELYVFEPSQHKAAVSEVDSESK